MPSLNVKIDLGPLKKYGKLVGKSSSGPFRDAFRDWAKIYLSFTRERFSNFSRGSGNWPPLKAATIAAKGSSGILIDNALMFTALQPTFMSKPGSIKEDIDFGVRVGFGGPGSYPNGVTIADVAGFHQAGRGVPKREIIVSPNQNAIQQMVRRVEKANKEAIKLSGN